MRATRFDGGEVTVAGKSYYIPTATECDRCHGGRSDRALGFQAALLGLPERAVKRWQCSTPPDGSKTSRLRPGSRSETTAPAWGAQAMGWLHVSCGVSCHNDNPTAEGYSAGLSLLLQAAQLDGRSSVEFDARITTLDVDSPIGLWAGRKRIVAGSPDESLLYDLLRTGWHYSCRRLCGVNRIAVRSRRHSLDRQWIQRLDER